MAMVKLTERVYLDNQGRATTDPEKAAYLWGTPGMLVRTDDLAAIGYSVGVVEVTDAPAEKAVKRPKGTKVIEGPGGDK